LANYLKSYRESKIGEDRVKDIVENTTGLTIEEYIKHQLLNEKPCDNYITFFILPKIFDTDLTIILLDLTDDAQVVLVNKVRKI